MALRTQLVAFGALLLVPFLIAYISFFINDLNDYRSTQLAQIGMQLSYDFLVYLKEQNNALLANVRYYVTEIGTFDGSVLATIRTGVDRTLGILNNDLGYYSELTDNWPRQKQRYLGWVNDFKQRAQTLSVWREFLDRIGPSYVNDFLAVGRARSAAALRMVLFTPGISESQSSTSLMNKLSLAYYTLTRDKISNLLTQSDSHNGQVISAALVQELLREKAAVLTQLDVGSGVMHGDLAAFAYSDPVFAPRLKAWLADQTHSLEKWLGGGGTFNASQDTLIAQDWAAASADIVSAELDTRQAEHAARYTQRIQTMALVSAAAVVGVALSVAGMCVVGHTMTVVRDRLKTGSNAAANEAHLRRLVHCRTERTIRSLSSNCQALRESALKKTQEFTANEEKRLHSMARHASVMTDVVMRLQSIAVTYQQARALPPQEQTHTNRLIVRQISECLTRLA